ncbi:MAG TPA: mycofactocin biosynthesis glycosyltransferase MftF [Mycobacterium sp.]|nr:mycofactocin biosynthesis glycosyltransferase MftF [Mycobacterium sp.]
MRREEVPLPHGFGVVFDPDTRFVSPEVLFGGSPSRVLRLNAGGARALAELRSGKVGSPDSGRLARQLTDTGLAHPRPPAAGSPAEVTVVIPVRDRPAGLASCLSELGSAYPVIVVDDGSADPAAVARLCEKHGARLRRRLVSGGAGPARNDGLAMVTTPFVAFLDSDCVAGPDWIERLVPHFADPMVGAVAPRVRPATQPGAVGRYLDARAPLDLGSREALVSPRTRVSYAPTAALLVRKEAIGAGFDPDLHFGEDVDLVWRMVDAGWRVRYDPAAEVRHTEPTRWAQVFARRFRYGNSAAPLSHKHPGQVPSLILHAWPAVSAGALLGRRPMAALAAYGAGTTQLVMLLREWGVPAKGVMRPMAGSVQQTWLGMGRWSIQFALPAVAAAIVWPGGGTRLARAGRRLALASLVAGPPAAEWLRTRPRLDPVCFALGYLADEAAYGAGVYRGALTEQTVAPLLPQIAWRPLPRAGETSSQ